MYISLPMDSSPDFLSKYIDQVIYRICYLGLQNSNNHIHYLQL